MKPSTIVLLILCGFFLGYLFGGFERAGEKLTMQAPYEIVPEYVTFNIEKASIYNGEKGTYILRVDKWEKGGE